MDTTEPRRGASEDTDASDHSNHSPASFHEAKQELPDDLPKSLDDRRSVPLFQPETEMYDAWQGECSGGTLSPRPQRTDQSPTTFLWPIYQPTMVAIEEQDLIFGSAAGQSQFLTAPVAAKPLSFSLALDDHAHDSEHDMRAHYGRDIEDNDARLMEMLAAQAAHREVDSLTADEETIAADEKLTDSEKRDILQKSLNMAASNGDVERVRKLVQGQAKTYVDVNMPDEEGTVPLIYASCFVG